MIRGLGVALADFIQKVFTKEALGSPYVFNFYTYALAIIPQAIILFILFKTKPKDEGITPNIVDKKHIIIYIIISASCI